MKRKLSPLLLKTLPKFFLANLAQSVKYWSALSKKLLSLLKIRSWYVKFTHWPIRRQIALSALFLVVIFAPLVYFLAIHPRQTEAAWFNESWRYRKAIPVTNNTTLQTNVFIGVSVNTSDTTRFQTDGGDIRFTNQTGEVLPYYLVSGVGTSNTHIHISLATFPAGVQTIYIYYGNPSADNGFSLTDFSPEASNYTIGTHASEETGPGPIAYWKFDEGVGTTAYDSTQNNNDGTFGSGSSAPTWQAEDMCISGKCLKFDGSNDYIQGGDGSSLNYNGGDFTVEGWFYFSDEDDGGIIISKGGFSTADGWLVYIGGSSERKLHCKGNAVTGADFNIKSDATLKDGWHHFTCLYDVNGTAKIYIDSIQNTENASLSLSNYDTATNLTLGTNNNYSSYFFNGFLDDIKIYPYARTAAQIKSDYNARGSSEGSSMQVGSGNQEDSLSNGLVGYWKMDETTGTTGADSSGNGRTGTLGTSVSAPGWVGGMYGNGLSFDGSNDYVSVGSTAPGVQTVSFWVKPGSTAVSFLDLNASAYITASGGTLTATGFSAPVYYVNGSATSTITSGSWQHITITTSSGITTSTAMKMGKANGAYYNGLFDEVRIYNRALSPAEVQDLYDWAPGPYLYLPFDDGSGATIADKSGNNYSGTWNGTSNHWATGKYGKAGYFNGDSSNDVSFSSLPKPANMPITFSFWVKSNSTSISGLFDSASGQSNVLRMYDPEGGIEWWASPKAAVTVSPNTWTHIGIIFSHDGTNRIIQWYKNGQLQTGSSAAGATTFSWSGFVLGNVNGSLTPYSGALDEFKIYNYARTAKQIVQDMNAGHPIGGSPIASQVGYWKFDEGYGTTVYNSGFVGSTANGTFGTGSSSPTWTNDGKFGKALYFDGTDDRINLGSNIALTTDWAISFWAKPENATEFQGVVGASNGNYINLESDRFHYSGTNHHYTTYSAGTSWKHFVLTRSSDNTVKLYIDGVQKDSYSDTDASFNISSIGTFWNRSTYTYQGYLDELKIYNSALTADEVKLEYNHGTALVMGSLSSGAGNTASSTAASQEYCIPGDTTACSPPLARWDMNEKTGSVIYDSTGNGNSAPLATGDSAPTWTIGKIGSGLLFDGDNDYINRSLNQYNAYTIESWFYLTSAPPSHAKIITIGNSISLGVGGTSYVNGFRYDTSWKTATSLTGLTLKRWHHAALTYNGSELTVYLDGKAGSSASAGGDYSGTTAAYIGCLGKSSQVFPGIIDNLRVFNYARTPAQIAWDYNRGGPVGHWKLDECQGTTALDSSGIGNSGSISIGASGTQTTVGTCTTSGSAWNNGATGKFNYSLNFDGADDYVEVPDSSSLDVTTAITLSAWIYPTTLGANERNIVAKDYPNLTDGQYAYGLAFDGSGYLYGWVDDDGAWGGNLLRALETAINVPTDTWTHVLMTYNGSQVKLYRNGINTATSSTASFTIKNSNQSLYIGHKCGWANYFAGKIDEVKVYNYSLTTTQIQQLFNQGSAVRFGPTSGVP